MPEVNAPATPAPPPPERRFHYRIAVERLAIAHFLGYPIAFVWACASMPLAIHLFIADIEILGGDMPAIGKLVVRIVAWPAGAAFALTHLAVLAWAFGRDAARGRRLFLFGLGAIAGAALLLGGASWLWLLLR